MSLNLNRSLTVPGHLFVVPFFVSFGFRHRLTGIIPVQGVVWVIFYRSTPTIRVYRRIIDTDFRFADFEVFPVQASADVTGSDFQRRHEFILFDAGFFVCGPI